MPNAGGTIKAGQPLYIDGSGLAQLASTASSVTSAVVGLAVADYTAGQPVTYQTNILLLTNWTNVIGSTNLTVGASYWLTSTPGQLAASSTGTQIGISVSSTTMQILHASTSAVVSVNGKTGVVTLTYTDVGADASGAAASAQTAAIASANSYTVSYAEPKITAGTTAQYWRGDKTWHTLDTSAVPENTNLYFTNARAIAAPLTGLSTATTTQVVAADSLLVGVGKLQGQIDVAQVVYNGVWASIPAASSNSGKFAFATDIGVGVMFSSDGSNWKAVGGRFTIAKLAANTIGTVTGTTVETNVANITVPAGLMLATSQIVVTTEWIETGSTNSKSHIVRIGGAAGAAFLNYSNVTTAQTSLRLMGKINNASLSTQLYFAGNTAGYGGSGGGALTASQNTALSFVIAISGKLTLGTETMSLYSYEVEIVH